MDRRLGSGRSSTAPGVGGGAGGASRTCLALCMCALMSFGCAVPFGTTGIRRMGGWDTQGAGLTAPLPIAGDPDAGGATFLELSGWVAPPENDLSYWTGERDGHSCFSFREFSVGIGKGGRRTWWGTDEEKWYVRSVKQGWWGCSAGLSYIDASLDDSFGTRYQDATVGAYAGAGVYNPVWGGLTLRLTLAPDVDMAGEKWGMSGVTVSYWWGWGTSGGLHAAPVGIAVSFAYIGAAFVCQAHRLLDDDPVVRLMAEEILLMAGETRRGTACRARTDYMEWAARTSPDPVLARRIREVMEAIRRGARADPARWPAAGECIARLDHPDRVTAIMAAQMLRAVQWRDGIELDSGVERRVEELLREGRARNRAGPWRRLREENPDSSGTVPAASPATPDIGRELSASGGAPVPAVRKGGAR